MPFYLSTSVRPDLICIIDSIESSLKSFAANPAPDVERKYTLLIPDRQQFMSIHADDMNCGSASVVLPTFGHEQYLLMQKVTNINNCKSYI